MSRRNSGRALAAGALAAAALLAARPWACVEPRCYEDGDCESPKVCGADGRCAWACESDADCGAGRRCEGHLCRSTGPVSCPADMVAVADEFCIDRYEASRADATSDGAGSGGGAARSRAGVLPWQVPDNAAAAAACAAAGKTLCAAQDWARACKGPAGSVYGYGNSYDATACNGIDAFGPGAFHLAPTGSFARCTNGWGPFDLNGNVWEHVAGGSDQTVRGGAYNCGDSVRFHRCDYVPGSWSPSAKGFRCCLYGSAAQPDAGSSPLVADGGEDGGCVTAPDAGGDAGHETPADGGADDPIDGGFDAGAPDAGPPDAGGADAGPADAGACPADMVHAGAFCIDRYEASRADATADGAGTSATATSRAGVQPWWPVDTATARAACLAAGKRLCRSEEWLDACRGPAQTVYSYGDAYEAAACNGIDAYCRCSSAACAAVQPCPYPRCWDTASAGGGGACGADFRVAPTGSFAGCESAHGAFDLNGNVWEVVDSSDGLIHTRGGAYNCGDSESLHRCDLEVTWNPPARGFRCCGDPR